MADTIMGAEQIGFDYKKLGYNDYDWDYTVNMMYSDYYSPKKTVMDYLDLAVAFLEDIEVSDSKPYRYWKRIVKNELV
jgi:hypothetical protein